MMWSCGECIRDGLQKKRGCEAAGYSLTGELIEIDGVIHHHCLSHLITDQSLAWVEEATMVRALRLPPEPGGLNDQFNRDLEALTMVLAALYPQG